MLTTADRASARPRIELVVVLLRERHADDERRQAASATPAGKQTATAGGRLTSSPSMAAHQWRHAR